MEIMVAYVLSFKVYLSRQTLRFESAFYLAEYYTVTSPLDSEQSRMQFSVNRSFLFAFSDEIYQEIQSSFHWDLTEHKE